MHVTAPGVRVGVAVTLAETVALAVRDGDTLLELVTVREVLALIETLGVIVVAGAMQQTGSVVRQGLSAKPAAVLATQLSLPSALAGKPGAQMVAWRLALLMKAAGWPPAHAHFV